MVLRVLVVTLAHTDRGRVGIVATYRGAVVLGVLVTTLVHSDRGIVASYMVHSGNLDKYT